MKKWMTLLLAAMLCISLIACSAEPETTADETKSDLRDHKLVLGSQMSDFTIEDALGNRYSLYELLEEKQMVMLNFWFINCPYCVMEFPDIDAAYGQYADRIAILAVNPYDSASEIVSFQKEYDLRFTMCEDDPGLCEAFGVTGYPTTVIVDRNGVVCLVQPGAVPYEEVFTSVFAYFTAEDYETTLFESIQDIYKKG